MWESIDKLWNKLEIRVLVISSLSLQIFLLALAGFRKHVVSVRWAQTTGFTWRGPLAYMFHLFLWLAYLLADYVATVALAYLPGSKINKATPENKTHHLLMFWAPFFILHLGGQDTITALSVEDNELWARHLLTLISQVALAMYNYFSLNLKVGALRLPAILMFGVAIFKYGERVLSLQRASMSALQSSMITKPDPGPNYAKFMQEYTSSNAAGLKAVIKVENEKHKVDSEKQHPKGDLEKQDPEDTNRYKEVVCQAYRFFKTFKRLFVDLILSYKNGEESQNYFEKLETQDAYKLIEIELTWMYKILHSKGSIIYSHKHYGWVSRVITLFVTIVALCLFALSNHTGYGQFETSLTYVLLGGAVGMEIIALIFMLLTFWTYASMKESWFYRYLSNFLFSIQERMRPQNKPRWSNKMAQYSLITYSIEDQPCWWKSIMKCLGIKETWDHYRYTICVTVNTELKNLVFQELKKKMKSIDDAASYRRFTSHRGQWALQRKGYYQEFGWSVEAEFDESLLLWHIATDLLFHDFEMSATSIATGTASTTGTAADSATGTAAGTSDGTEAGSTTGTASTIASTTETATGTAAGSATGTASSVEEQPPAVQKTESKMEWEISQNISNYMLFLLIVRPFMMPAGIGQIRFGDTCVEAANFLQPLGDIEKRHVKNSNTETGNVKNGDVKVGNVGEGNTAKDNTKKNNTKKGNDVRRILEVNTEYDPGLIKGDRSKSVLFRGCMLAHDLKDQFTDGEKTDWNKMWRLISVVWVEMLCYAASKCSGQFHAKQLSKGGELLTVVWFLMAHMGMGEQYRIEEGHARAKLIVSK